MKEEGSPKVTLQAPTMNNLYVSNVGRVTLSKELSGNRKKFENGRTVEGKLRYELGHDGQFRRRRV